MAESANEPLASGNGRASIIDVATRIVEEHRPGSQGHRSRARDQHDDLGWEPVASESGTICGR